jgi:putative NIF3 family GTP cyclohydrolase 1 type 2
LENIEPFGEYKGIKIGYKGVLSEPAGTEEIIKRIFGYRDSRINVLGFGGEKNSSVGIISGSAAFDVSQAIKEKLDLYITGEVSHAVYHECREAGINVIFAGHYLSETFGVKAVSEKVQDDLGIDTVFLDIPTGY